MKKYFAIIFLALALPSFVFAAWYNPFSWFKKNTASVSDVFKNEPEIKEVIKDNPDQLKIIEQLNARIAELEKSLSENKCPVCQKCESQIITKEVIREVPKEIIKEVSTQIDAKTLWDEKAKSDLKQEMNKKCIDDIVRFESENMPGGYESFKKTFQYLAEQNSKINSYTDLRSFNDVGQMINEYNKSVKINNSYQKLLTECDIAKFKYQNYK